MDEKPPFVLVHGAWHGGWCWRRVVPMLEAAGHKAFAPTCRGVGERAGELTAETGLESYIQDIIAVIEAAALTDVILVGHSHGGWIIAGVADRMPGRIARLIFLDANLVRTDTTPFSTLSADVVAARRLAATRSPGGLTMPAPPAGAFGISDPADVAWVEAHLTPQPLKTYEDALRLDHPIGNGSPVSYVACVDPPFEGVAPARERARREPDWSYMEIASGHDAMVIAPGLLAATLLDIAARPT